MLSCIQGLSSSITYLRVIVWVWLSLYVFRRRRSQTQTALTNQRNAKKVRNKEIIITRDSAIAIAIAIAIAVAVADGVVTAYANQNKLYSSRIGFSTPAKCPTIFSCSRGAFRITRAFHSGNFILSDLWIVTTKPYQRNIFTAPTSNPGIFASLFLVPDDNYI